MLMLDCLEEFIRAEAEKSLKGDKPGYDIDVHAVYHGKSIHGYHKLVLIVISNGNPKHQVNMYADIDLENILEWNPKLKSDYLMELMRGE